MRCWLGSCNLPEEGWEGCSCCSFEAGGRLVATLRREDEADGSGLALEFAERSVVRMRFGRLGEEVGAGVGGMTVMGWLAGGWL